MGAITLVERKKDKKLFAAKKQQKTNLFDFLMAKKELKMLQLVDHKNIVKFEQSFFSENSREIIIIMEYCEYGDLQG